ncbi:MAG: TonB-dependent receptor [Brevundimonas sp.]|nr:TonB-dependent receptor [Brevundimonas sp.]
MSALVAPALTGAVAALTLTVSPAQAQTAPLQTFDIPAQDASAALLQLCAAADCDLAFVRSSGPAVRTQAVRGRMTWRQALDRMLQGTPLRRRFIGERGVRVWVEARPATRAAPPPPPPPPEEPTELSPVIVLGRLSDQIDEALARKRDADIISDVVTAGRIGDLPAANLAEALQRAPGVAVEREVGEGQFVSVRGLGPLFQSVTLNGAPVAFNENIRNSTQSGRQFRFRALSPDLLAGATLSKSATPDMIDGGIGSNIDIETVGGLDDEPFLTLRAGGEIEARTGRPGAELSVAGRAVSTDGNLGVVAGVSQEDRSVRYDRFQIQRYGEVEIGGTTVIAPSDVRTTVEREDRRRRSAFLGADWRVSSDLLLDLDALASTFDNAIREDRLVYGFGERLAQPGSSVLIRNGVVTGGEVTGGRIDNNTEISDQAHLNLAVSAGARARLGDWRLEPRISVSVARSVLDTPLERISAQTPVGVSYAFDLGEAADQRRALRLTTDLNLTDPTLLLPPKLAVRAVESRDDDLTAVLHARRPLDLPIGPVRLAGLRIGGQFSDRSRDYQRRDRQAALRPGAVLSPEAYDSRTPADVFSDLIVQRSTPWATVDFNRVREIFVLPGERDDIVFRPGDVQPTGTDLQNSYAVRERVAAAYVRLDVDGADLRWPVSGHVGLRLVETRTEVDGSILGMADGVAEVRPVTASGSHGVWLPSANLTVDLGEHSLLRLAASRSITRPSLADLRSATVPASVLVSAIYDRGQAEIDSPTPGIIFSGVGGNPELTPYIATNLDLSWELTLPRGALSVAVFHKTIDDFIQMQAAPERLTFETRAGPPVQAEVMMSRPRNVGRAKVDGLEVGLHRRFGGGFGVWASATWSDSRIEGSNEPLLGVSDLSWSVSPFYERDRLAVNLSWSWRSAFRSEADMQGGGVSSFIVAPAGYLDAQASWALNDRVRVVLTGSNLTDTIDQAREGGRDRLLQLGQAGPSMSLAFSWTL